MITCKIIKELVEKEACLPDISIKCRDTYLVDCRSVYCELTRIYAKALKYPSLEKRGKYINRHYSTVLHGVKMFNDNYDTVKFTATEIFNRCLKILSEHVESDDEDINKIIKEIDIKHYYKIKHLRLSLKYRSVINKLSYKLSLYRRHKFIQKVMELNEFELNELEYKFDVFLKVKEKLREKSNINSK